MSSMKREQSTFKGPEVETTIEGVGKGWAEADVEMMGLDGGIAWGMWDLVVGLVYTGEEENLGQEEAHTEVQVEVGVAVTNGMTQQEGRDGQDETQQGDDHAHMADDGQGELHLSGERYATQTGINIPPSRKKNYPDSWFG